MCGIFGQISPSLASASDACSAAIRHRGPDDGGSRDFEIAVTPAWLNLSRRRLSIIDFSRASLQSMSNEDGTVWIIFNGEVYNFQELHSQLVAAGHRFRSRTDTEAFIPRL